MKIHFIIIAIAILIGAGFVIFKGLRGDYKKQTDTKVVVKDKPMALLSVVQAIFAIAVLAYVAMILFK